MRELGNDGMQEHIAWANIMTNNPTNLQSVFRFLQNTFSCSNYSYNLRQYISKRYYNKFYEIRHVNRHNSETRNNLIHFNHCTNLFFADEMFSSMKEKISLAKINSICKYRILSAKA